MSAVACGAGSDQLVALEDAPDGGDGGGRLTQAVGQVVGDGLGSGVMAGGDQLPSQREDGFDDLAADLAGGREPSQKHVEPAPGDAVVAGDVGRTAALHQHRVDDVALQAHPDTSFR